MTRQSQFTSHGAPPTMFTIITFIYKLPPSPSPSTIFTLPTTVQVWTCQEDQKQMLWLWWFIFHPKFSFCLFPRFEIRLVKSRGALRNQKESSEILRNPKVSYEVQKNRKESYQIWTKFVICFVRFFVTPHGVVCFQIGVRQKEGHARRMCSRSPSTKTCPVSPQNLSRQVCHHPITATTT